MMVSAAFGTPEDRARRHMPAFMHALAEVRILRVVHDERAEVLGVEQRVAHDLVSATLLPFVNAIAPALQQPISVISSLQALGERGHRVHATGITGAAWMKSTRAT